MAVTTDQFFIIYQPDGLNAVFPYPFKIQQSTDLKVFFQATYQSSTTYVLNGVGDDNGGTVVFSSPPQPTDGTILIMRLVELTQETEWIDNDPFLAQPVEDAFDKLTMITQQLYTARGVLPISPWWKGKRGQWYGNSSPRPGAPFGWVWWDEAQVWLGFGEINEDAG